MRRLACLVFFICLQMISSAAPFTADVNLPLGIIAKIPRHADLLWYSALDWKGGVDRDEFVTLYSLPVIGGNDSIVYLECFVIDGKGSVRGKDRIYLGGRGVRHITGASIKDQTIVIDAKEHGSSDPIATPSIDCNIVIRWVDEVISVVKIIPSNN